MEADMLAGGGGGDFVQGNGGDDIMRGNDGADTVGGGAGDDRFLSRDGDGTDIVVDFANNELERFDLRGLVAGAQTFGQLMVTDTAGKGVTVNYGTGSILVTNINLTAQFDAGEFLF